MEATFFPRFLKSRLYRKLHQKLKIQQRMYGALKANDMINDTVVWDFVKYHICGAHVECMIVIIWYAFVSRNIYGWKARKKRVWSLGSTQSQIRIQQRVSGVWFLFLIARICHMYFCCVLCVPKTTKRKNVIFIHESVH